MFSLKQVDPINSRSFAVIIEVKHKDKKIERSVVETLYRTPLLRHTDIDYDEGEHEFNLKMKKYCSKITDDEFILKLNYEFEMACHYHVAPGYERFFKLIVGLAGSGKTFTLAKLIEKYHQAFPKSSIIYGSTNDVSNEPAFAKLKELALDENGKPMVDEKGKKTGKMVSYIKELDIPELESKIDVFEPHFHQSLILFDDLDNSPGGITYNSIDPTLTPEKFKTLGVKEQVKIMKSVQEKSDLVSDFLKDSAQDIIAKGRKQEISFCYILHEIFSGGTFENYLVSAANSIVLFPEKMDKTRLSEFLKKKMFFTKADAEYIVNKKWHCFDFLEIDKTSGQRFGLMNDTLKLF